MYPLLFSHPVMPDSLWPLDWSTPGSPVLHRLLEFAQTHVPWVGDAVQPSHSLAIPFSFFLWSFPTSGSFLSQPTQSGQSTGASASVLPVNIQGWFPSDLTSSIPLQSKGFSRVYLNKIGEIYKRAKLFLNKKSRFVTLTLEVRKLSLEEADVVNGQWIWLMVL